MKWQRHKPLRYIRFWCFVLGHQIFRKSNPAPVEEIKKAYEHVLKAAGEHGFEVEAKILAEEWGLEL